MEASDAPEDRLKESFLSLSRSSFVVPFVMLEEASLLMDGIEWESKCNFSCLHAQLVDVLFLVQGKARVRQSLPVGGGDTAAMECLHHRE